MGFEPTISALTGRRALLAAPRGRVGFFSFSSSGGNRTDSIPGSKPGWSANCLPSRAGAESMCPKWESNPHPLGFKPGRSAGWRTWAIPPGILRVVPDGIEPSLSGCKPEVVPLDHGTGLYSVDSPGIAPESPACGAGVFLLDDEPVVAPEAEAVGLEPTSGAWPPPVFKTGSSSGRMTSVIGSHQSSGGWNRTNGLLVQSQASLPTATAPE